MFSGRDRGRNIHFIKSVAVKERLRKKNMPLRGVESLRSDLDEQRI